MGTVTFFLTVLCTAFALRPPVLLLYDTEPVTPNSPLHDLLKSAERAGLESTLIGTDTIWNGWGSKYRSLIPVLRSLPSNTLVIAADTRDVIANFPLKNVGAELEKAFTLITRDPKKVVMSAEAQCCVSALTHAEPGSFFHGNGSRRTYSCLSGYEDCPYIKQGSVIWKNVMRHHAMVAAAAGPDVFLNAGLQAGYADSLLKLYECMAILEYEDDQAILTDLFIQKVSACPDIVLDYDHILFGNARWELGMPEACPFAYNTHLQQIEMDQRNHPFFLHFSNHFSECFNLVNTMMGRTSRFPEEQEQEEQEEEEHEEHEELEELEELEEIEHSGARRKGTKKSSKNTPYSSKVGTKKGKKRALDADEELEEEEIEHSGVQRKGTKKAKNTPYSSKVGTKKGKKRALDTNEELEDLEEHSGVQRKGTKKGKTTPYSSKVGKKATKKGKKRTLSTPYSPKVKQTPKQTPKASTKKGKKRVGAAASVGIFGVIASALFWRRQRNNQNRVGYQNVHPDAYPDATATLSV